MRNSEWRAVALALVMGSFAAAGCGNGSGDGAVRATGYVEATEVRVSAEVGGRVLEVAVDEGARVQQGSLLARLDTTDLELALRRARAERDAADAQLRLLQAGARPEELRQAQAQVDAAEADVRAVRAELESAGADLARFESLLAANAGSRKQRDDAATRREQAAARVAAAEERARGAREFWARLRSGARRQEIEAARARVGAVDAQIASIEENIRDARLVAPVGGVVTTRLIDPGEMIAPSMPAVVITDLDHAWANVYVEEPYVPRIKLGESVQVITDAGQRLPGKVTFISPRAEFTPRNVQTANDRAKLVYRMKVSVDNREGVLKPGMPVEAEFAAAPVGE
ncbi:MAG TPA: HlyD family efflux transporter periplasmic adaptor subunit [Vicinamibacterales bacterium]|nr:HlyD family efflux transporter periplasmic adaptor subunit [Vicinamibacterales bacterium]